MSTVQKRKKLGLFSLLTFLSRTVECREACAEESMSLKLDRGERLRLGKSWVFWIHGHGGAAAGVAAAGMDYGGEHEVGRFKCRSEG